MCHAAQGPCRWSRWLGIRFAIRSYVMFWIHRIPLKATLTIREVYVLGCLNASNWMESGTCWNLGRAPIVCDRQRTTRKFKEDENRVKDGLRSSRYVDSS